MNTCPVYRRSGGHSYQTTVPGPIGSILAPSRNAKTYSSLPFACSLCGSCSDVCPVKIDLHTQLLTWRKEIVVRKLLPWTKRMAMRVGSIVLSAPALYRTAGKLARWLVPKLPRFMVYNRFNDWGRQRELPPMPKRSFREQFAARQSQKRPES